MMPYRVRVLVFNATFNNISVILWRSVLLVEEMPFETIFLLLAGGALKLEKIWFFGVKSWFFTRNTPTIFAPPSARRNFFKCALPPNLKSWIRPWLVYSGANFYLLGNRKSCKLILFNVKMHIHNQNNYKQVSHHCRTTFYGGWGENKPYIYILKFPPRVYTAKDIWANWQDKRAK